MEKVDGSMTFLILTKEGIYAVRDRLGRTPLIIGKRTTEITAFPLKALLL